MKHETERSLSTTISITSTRSQVAANNEGHSLTDIRDEPRGWTRKEETSIRKLQSCHHFPDFHHRISMRLAILTLRFATSLSMVAVLPVRSPTVSPLLAFQQPLRGSRLSACIYLCASEDHDESSAAVGQTAVNAQQKLATLGRKLFDAVFLVWMVIVQTLGAVIGLGLLLNLSGWGYRLQRSPPFVEIRTLDAMRRDVSEQRFLRDAQRAAVGGELFPTSN